MEKKQYKSQLQMNPYINTELQQDTAEPTLATPTAPVVNPYYNTQINTDPTQVVSPTSLLGSFDTANFLKGALIGAIGAYILTNENAQKTIFKTIAKGGDMLNAGIEELKERMEDAKAELEAEKEAVASK
mgnify:CR=1 FL=1